MFSFNRRGFTLVEIMTVVVILGTLSTALYMGAQPYMKRSRDVKRITDIGSYLNILDAYNANFETFPSNYGSGNSLTLGYCLTEMANRPDYVGFRDMQFGNLRANTSVAPRDPSNLPPIAPCDMTGSYLYSRLDYAFDKQLVVIAARLEMRESGNYGTGADLIIPANYQSVIDAKKGSVLPSYPDGLFVTYRIK